jgi:aspartate-semialdehyde dehydrogenase
MAKIPVGVLAATGTVGQRFIQLLAQHPWFEVTAVAASDRSAGRRYAEACHWLLPTPIPPTIGDLVVQRAEPSLRDHGMGCRLVFSALPSHSAGPAEESFAQAGYVVCSNAAPHRLTADVPVLIPEVNPDHTALLPLQKKRRGGEGLIVTSANCSTTQLALALKPLHETFGLRRVSVVTLQAISGAGYPGVASMDIIGNIIPFIPGEEEKLETETCKLLGTLEQGRIALAPIVISAQCNRVPVRDGHTACVSVEFTEKPELDTLLTAWEGFRPSTLAQNLPSSPDQPILVHKETDRPQPIRDRDLGNGMSISIGRARDCSILDVKFVLLGHNTVRGAAGGAIHNAELLVAQGWLD